MSLYVIKKFSFSPVKYKHVFLYRDFEKKIEKIPREKWKKNTEKTPEALSRAKSIITEIALNNKFDYFCTFSFDKDKIDRYDLKECYKRLRLFFKEFKKRYAPNFQWLIIPEFHKDGAIHFHGLVSGIPDGELTVPDTIMKRMSDGEIAVVPNTPKYLYWARYSKRFGIFNCSKIKTSEGVAYYVTKYVIKELSKIPTGVNLYAHSKGLKKADVIYHSYNDSEMLITPSYKNDFCKVAYDKYEGVYQALESCGIEIPFVGNLPENQYNIKLMRVSKDKVTSKKLGYGTEIYNEDYEIEYLQTQIQKNRPSCDNRKET